MKKVCVIIAGLWLILSSCCPTCSKPNVGDFNLNEGSAEWLDFTIQTNRIFRSNQGTEASYTYFDVVSEFQPNFFDCDDNTRCGLCCASYNSAFVYVQLANTDGSNRFDIAVLKDFRNNVPTDDPATIPDMISITFNGDLELRIDDIPNATSSETLVINGRTFANVFTVEADPNQIFPNTGQPIAYHFTKALGIVGFELEGGVEWSLEL